MRSWKSIKKTLFAATIGSGGFCKRNSFTSPRITHHGQEDKRDAVYVKRTVEGYLLAVQHLTADLDSAHKFNMDEAPVYVDITGRCTLDFNGARSVNLGTQAMTGRVSPLLSATAWLVNC